ncbi:MAG TPA: L-arabinose isomerase [Terriglobales bacterium]|nr:L-arabinose isomerase [Terriglobales bacterium]
MIDFANLEIWFVTGSQHLYGPETLQKVAEHATAIAKALGASSQVPVKVVFKPVMTGSDSIHQLCLEANSSKNCIGLVTWMHTFSPARMWIAGLRSLDKPFVHLHTQFNEHLPWSTIDMDFMNLNQSAHGDREFGFITSRMKLRPKIIVGFWGDADVHAELGRWIRSACAWHDAKQLKVARFGDNMRNVAVTEGNKVSAEINLRYAVNGYGVGDLVQRVQQVSDPQINDLVAIYDQTYTVSEPLRAGGSRRESLRDAARIEIGLRKFLDETGSHAFTDTFEDLHGLKQLPGLAVQRLMADGYGFGAEGDWKTSALVRAVKVMSHGLKGGASFMEDYTYHFGNGGQVLGAHMLEVCPSIAADKPSVEIHPLSIGGKEDPVRLVFTAAPGRAVNASVVDMGNRFRLIVSQVNIIKPEHPLPKLPVARAVWIPEPNLKIAATAWITAGGAHHTALSPALTAEHLENFADMSGMEYLLIDADTKLAGFKNELRWNDVYYRMANGF